MQHRDGCRSFYGSECISNPESMMGRIFPSAHIRLQIVCHNCGSEFCRKGTVYTHSAAAVSAEKKADCYIVSLHIPGEEETATIISVTLKIQ